MNQIINKNLSYFLKKKNTFVLDQHGNFIIKLLPIYNGDIDVDFFVDPDKSINFIIKTNEFSISDFKSLEKIFIKSYENPKIEIMNELIDKLDSLSKTLLYRV